MKLNVLQHDLTDNLLHRICHKLQINDSQREMAKQRYEAVGKWLGGDVTLYSGADLQVYAQGSLSIGTTVKPLSGQEFDLDIVCEFDAKWRGKNPLELLKAVEKRMREHKTYAPMVELKNRCVRLNYANEFHMDILPAVPTDASGDGRLKVPDRKAQNWKDSNPKGYAEWFKQEASQVKHVFMEKAAEIEPFPSDETVDLKPPLKRAVQLIKRYRDVYFEKNPDNAPISIVLTTLSAQHYNGEASVNAALMNILSGIKKSIAKSGKRLVVLNPKNHLEDLSERWEAHPNLYHHFVEFIEEFVDEWMEVNSRLGIQNVAEKLKSMFGEHVTVEALSEQAAAIEKARKSKLLKVSNVSGAITTFGAGSTLIKGNTFYGED